MRAWLVAAALLGLASVGFGAFGAHGVTDPRAQEWLRTGALYGFVHVLATFAASQVGARWPQPFFVVGVIVFSGALWAMSLGGPRMLGAVAPLGGASLMVGWGLLAFALLRRQA
jgi:uncharacterized membrane protein YgdD (TMEM256/DUF423 family)